MFQASFIKPQTSLLLGAAKAAPIFLLSAVQVLPLKSKSGAEFRNTPLL
jgi:hypothetical protein